MLALYACNRVIPTYENVPCVLGFYIHVYIFIKQLQSPIQSFCRHPLNLKSLILGHNIHYLTNIFAGIPSASKFSYYGTNKYSTYYLTNFYNQEFSNIVTVLASP